MADGWVFVAIQGSGGAPTINILHRQPREVQIGVNKYLLGLDEWGVTKSHGDGGWRMPHHVSIGDNPASLGVYQKACALINPHLVLDERSFDASPDFHRVLGSLLKHLLGISGPCTAWNHQNKKDHQAYDDRIS